MRSLPELDYTADAHRDLQRYRRFLRRHSPTNVRRRMRELVDAIRMIREFPEMNRVRRALPDSGLQIRRYNAGQLVIAYVYLKPSESNPKGTVSLRGFRHAGMEDALWMVREASAEELAPSFLSTRSRNMCQGYEPLHVYGEITFAPNSAPT